MNMANGWSAEDAKNRFGELVGRCLADGPQIISQHGQDVAVLVPIAQWRRMEEATKPSLKDLLLHPGYRIEELAPPRTKHTPMPPPDLE